MAELIKLKKYAKAASAKKVKIPTKYDPFKQVAGYKKRLSAVAPVPADISDSRNAFEKWANLPKNQSWFWDGLELWQRPQQYAYQFIDSLLENSMLDSTVAKPSDPSKPFENNWLRKISTKEGRQNIAGETLKFSITANKAHEEGMRGLQGSNFVFGSQILEKYTDGLTVPDYDIRGALFERSPGKDYSGKRKLLPAYEEAIERSAFGLGYLNPMNRDFVGFLMDVFLDPADIIPIVPIASELGKAGKAVTDGAQTLKTANKIVEAADIAVDATKKIKKVNVFKTKAFTETSKQLIEQSNVIFKTVKGPRGVDMAAALRLAASADNAVDFYRYAKAFTQMADTKKVVSLTELIFTGVRFGTEGVLKSADNMVVRMLYKLDVKAGKLGIGLNPDELAKIIDPMTNLGKHNNFFNSIDAIFNAAKQLPPKLWDRVGLTRGAKNMWDDASLRFSAEATQLISEIAEKTGRDRDEVSKLLMRMYEFNDLSYKTKVREFLGDKDTIRSLGFGNREKTEISKFLREMKDEAGRRMWDEKSIEALFVKQTDKATGVSMWFFDPKVTGQLTSEVKTYINQIKRAYKKGLISIEDYTRILQLFDGSFEKTRFYGKADLQELRKLFADSNFKKGYEQSKDLLNRIYKTLDFEFGTNFAETASEGYLRHTKNPDAYKNVSEFQTKFKQPKKAFRGNIKVASDRAYRMSAYEANIMHKLAAQNILDSGIKLSGDYRKFWENQASVDLFKEYMDTSIADFMNQVGTTAESAKLFDEIAMLSTFGDETLVRAHVKGNKVPVQMVEVDKSLIVNKIKGLEIYRRNPAALEDAVKMLNRHPGGKLLMNVNLFQLLGYDISKPAFVEAMFKAIDFANNLFKKLVLLSPGYHMRNISGNFGNVLVSGADIPKWLNKTGDAAMTLNKAKDIMDKVTKAGANTDRNILVKILSPEEVKMYDTYVEFIRNGLAKTGGKLYDLPPDLLETLGKPVDKVGMRRAIFVWNAKMNEQVDSYYRLVSFMYAKENPELLYKLGLNSPSDFVRRVHFDPNDLTQIEREYLKRLVPFYTFTKKNIAYHMKNFFDNPTSYKRFMETMDKSWDVQGLDKYNDVEAYKRNNFWVPIWRFADGRYVAVKFNLPLGDMFEFVDDPVKKVLTSSSPVLRAPFEYFTNQQIYTGLPIEDFPGQTGYSLPFLTRKQEYLASQIGLTTPVSQIYKTGKTINDIIQGDLNIEAATSLEGLSQGALQSVFSIGDPQVARRRAAFDELAKLRDLMAYYKQEEIDIPTIAELENKTKNNAYNNLVRQMKAFKR